MIIRSKKKKVKEPFNYFEEELRLVKIKASSIKYILLVISILSIMACDEEQEEVIECPEIIRERFSEILDSSLLVMPYLNSRKVVFQDSSNNELVFKVREFELQDNPTNYIISDYCNGIDSITINHTLMYKSVHVKNDSLDIKLGATIRTELNEEYLKQGYVADGIRITIADPDIVNRGRVLFQSIINKRKWKKEWAVNTLDSVQIGDRYFKNVFYNEPAQFQSPVYFNYDFGILNFTDRRGVTFTYKYIE